MKTTGIVRRVDDFGRIVLPKEIRKNIGMQEGDPVEIFVTDDSVILKRYEVGISIEEKVKQLNVAVDNVSSDLGLKKTEEIKRYLNEIELILRNKK